MEEILNLQLTFDQRELTFVDIFIMYFNGALNLVISKDLLCQILLGPRAGAMKGPGASH